MKKFKLLKDLPRAKAGSIVCITNAHSNSDGIVKINKWNDDELQRPRLAFIHKKDINEWLEEIIEKPKSVWELEEGDGCYCIDTDGDIGFSDFFNDNIDKKRLEVGSTFLTREEARKELNKRKAIQRIKKFCWENGIELADRIYISNANNDKYEIVYGFDECRFGTKLFMYHLKSCFFIFKERDDAQKVIDNCEADLRIIFDV